MLSRGQEVKDYFGTGLYCKLFQSIIDTTKVQRQAASVISHDSLRKSDSDPYYISIIDLTILLAALENLNHRGISLLPSIDRTSAIVQWSEAGQDYPHISQMTDARDLAMSFSSTPSSTETPHSIPSSAATTYLEIFSYISMSEDRNCTWMFYICETIGRADRLLHWRGDNADQFHV